MAKARELVPFSNPKPLVPGAPGGRSGSGYWKQSRQIEALKADMDELGKVLARLSGELIEQVIWLQDPKQKSPEAIRRRISQCMGALKREKSLLNGLLASGFDLHPILAQLYLTKAQEHVSSVQGNEVEPLLVPPEEALVIDQPAAASWKFVCSLTERERELLVAFVDEPHDAPAAAKKLGIAAGTVNCMISRLREKWRSLSTKGESKP